MWHVVATLLTNTRLRLDVATYPPQEEQRLAQVQEERTRHAVSIRGNLDLIVMEEATWRQRLEQHSPPWHLFIAPSSRERHGVPWPLVALADRQTETAELTEFDVFKVSGKAGFVSIAPLLNSHCSKRLFKHFMQSQ